MDKSKEELQKEFEKYLQSDKFTEMMDKTQEVEKSVEESFEKLLDIGNPSGENSREYRKRMEFMRSKENLELCKPFIADCDRLAKIAMKYQDQCLTLKDQLSKEVTTEKYGIGGGMMYRGYYCPSPILDIVIGNINRGRLSKRIVEGKKDVFKYGFNVDNNLILVEFIPDVPKYVDVLDFISTEVIIRDGETELGIVFKIWKGELRLEQLSESVYRNNRIVSFVYCCYSGFQNRVDIYEKEEYVYSDEGLDFAHRYDFRNHETAPSLTHYEYRFKHDDEGYLSQYAVIEHPDSLRRKEPAWDGHMYDVKRKRKV